MGKIKDYFHSLPVGEVVNKQGLAYLKRLGFIWEYSQWGYLESVSIYPNDDNSYQMRHCFEYGNAKELEKYPKAKIDGYRQLDVDVDDLGWDAVWEKFGNDRRFTFDGVEFETKYLDGCFCPYLIKCGPKNGKEVNRRMSLWGAIC